MEATSKPDPFVDAVGFDVTECSAEELERLGVRVSPRVVVVSDADEVWMTHTAFEAANPREEMLERAYVRSEAFRHSKRFGSLRGLYVTRLFPCAGTFRSAGADGAIELVQCDTCGKEFGVKAVRPDDDESRRDDFGGF